MYSGPTDHETLHAAIEALAEPGHAADAEREARIQRAQSPGLSGGPAGAAPAYEMKFLLAPGLAHEVESLLAPRMDRDPHAEPELNGKYRITTLYLDTAELDVFRRAGKHGRRKYRLRRYGDERVVYLERKLRRGDRVKKRRSRIDSADLELLADFQSPEGWPGEWFHQELTSQRLHPVCCIQYLRTAYVGADTEGPLRLTFDRMLRGEVCREWALPGHSCAAADLLAGQVICEMKFRGGMPVLFKNAVHELCLAPQGASKYRRCMGFACTGSKGLRANA